MKKLLLMIALCCGILTANAQREVGVFTLQPKIGISMSTLTNADFYYSEGLKMDASWGGGYLVGAEAEYQFAPKVSIAAGVVYSRHGCL